MRIVATFLLSGMCFFVGIHCYAQDPCAIRHASKPGEEPLAASELVHRLLLQTPPEKRRQIAFGDVEAILKCGTQEDAAEFFAAVRNRSARMYNVAVAEAGQDFVRVSWDDGFNPNLRAFRFNFDQPVDVIPHPGDRVTISGTYSSYSRDPFQINLTNASFVPMNSKQ